MSKMPAMNAGNTASMKLNEKPKLIIQAVSVVPMLAPMMTDMAWASVKSPALTVNLFLVIVPRMWRNCEPAIFCRASLITFIP